ncbi:MAG TPA: magnesium chelatase, partial [Vicinamibacteria bacterium]
MNELPKSLGELKSSDFSEKRLKGRGVRDEIRVNLTRMLTAGEELFPGIVGYEDSVLPHITNALLSRHHFILLGLRGQAKSRILRSLTRCLDEAVPAVDGCEIHDDPYTPLCRACRRRIQEQGDDTPIQWLGREERYV